jgi:hypothetical protein
MNLSASSLSTLRQQAVAMRDGFRGLIADDSNAASQLAAIRGGLEAVSTGTEIGAKLGVNTTSWSHRTEGIVADYLRDQKTSTLRPVLNEAPQGFIDAIDATQIGKLLQQEVIFKQEMARRGDAYADVLAVRATLDHPTDEMGAEWNSLSDSFAQFLNEHAR